MNASGWISWITTLISSLITSGIGLYVLQKLFNRKAERDERERKVEEDRKQKQRDDDEAARRRLEHEELLADARATAQRSALEAAHIEAETFRRMCEDCQRRILSMEERAREHEARERKLVAALRATIRALDSDDPAAKQAAIEAGRELI